MLCSQRKPLQTAYRPKVGGDVDRRRRLGKRRPSRADGYNVCPTSNSALHDLGTACRRRQKTPPTVSGCKGPYRCSIVLTRRPVITYPWAETWKCMIPCQPVRSCGTTMRPTAAGSSSNSTTRELLPPGTPGSRISPRSPRIHRGDLFRQPHQNGRRTRWGQQHVSGGRENSPPITTPPGMTTATTSGPGR